MHIGMIGLGVVGTAVKHGLEKINHTVAGYDIKYPATSLDDVLSTELCFICVPSNNMPDGSCDTSIVESVVHQLTEKCYAGAIVIKSTVTPGTSARLAKECNRPISFCPEFLRERAAYTDFLENHDVCVIGTESEDTYELIKKAHGHLPKNVAWLTPTEAELSKYFSNVYNAMHIVFANEFYEVSKSVGADYAKIKNAMVKRANISDVYLDCNENFRGYGGVCLPKDTLAFASFVKQQNLDLELFKLIVNENKKFKSTIFDGMRESGKQV